MTNDINPKEYWKTDQSIIPRLTNYIENTLPQNQADSVVQSLYLSETIDTL